MGYCDTLYSADNIIGFTGKGTGPDWHKAVTVYFENADFAGHITQQHGDASNIGREPAYDKVLKKYLAGNVGTPLDATSKGDYGVFIGHRERSDDVDRQAEIDAKIRASKRKGVRLQLKFAESMSDSFHISRNTLTALRPEDKTLLAQAIIDFQYLKPMYR